MPNSQPRNIQNSSINLTYIDKDGDNNNPTADTCVAVHSVASVQATNEEHYRTHTDAAANDALTATPCVCPNCAGDGCGEDDDCGDAGYQKGCSRALDAGSLEDEWCVLLSN